MPRKLPWNESDKEPERATFSGTADRSLPWDPKAIQTSGSSSGTRRKRNASPGPSGSSKRHAIDVDSYTPSVDLTQDDEPVDRSSAGRNFSLVDLTHDDENGEEAGYGCVITKIVGMQYYSGIASPGEQVRLEREPRNPYDPNAIKVSNVRGAQVGHVPRTVASKLARFMDDGVITWEGTLQEPVNNYAAGLCITIFGPADLEQKTALVQNMSDAGISLKKDPATVAREKAEKEAERERKKAERERERAEKRAAAERRKQMKNRGGGGGNVPLGTDPGSSHVTFDDLEAAGAQPSDAAWQDLVSGSAQFNPRDVQSVVDKMGKGEEELKNLPFASQPAAIKTKLLPYQLQGLGWLLKLENPELPGVKDELVQMWRESPVRQGCFENVATKYVCKKEELEKTLCSGGILSDDMGLGKTLQMISLICADVTKEKDIVYKPRSIPKDRIGTLILAPVSVMSNWSGQIASHVKEEHQLSVCLYHGTGRKDLDPSKYDVVISSYGTLTSDAENKRTKNNLFSFKWRRIILDEGHSIRNPKSKVSIAAAGLSGESKWCLTGTPIINNLKDLFSLVRFIGLGGGLSEWDYFNSVIIRPLNRGGDPGLLQAMMAQLCLRRMKDMKFVDLKIPPLSEYIHRIPFAKDERKKYDLLEAEAKGILKDYLNSRGVEGVDSGAQYRNLLEVLLRMRQLCNHHSLCGERLTKLMEFAKEAQGKKVEMNAENVGLLQDLLQLVMDSRDCEECAICLDEISDKHQPVITLCKHVFGRECIERVIKEQKKCPMCRCALPTAESSLVEARVIKEEEDDDEDADDSQVDDSTSSKLEALMNILKANSDKQDGSKVVIFSQWTSFLDIIQARLNADGYSFTRIDGTMTVKKRDAALEKLDNDDDCTIMLASLAVCSVGLNLTSASVAILMDPWWAPAIEDQAVDRIHRLGQTKPTQVFRLVMEKSVEDRVLEVQAKKRELVSDAFMDKGKRKRGQGKEARVADLQTLLSTQA